VKKPLVGREAQLAFIDRWLADRRHAIGPPALFVSGEAGVGKTALLDAADTGRAAVRHGSATPWPAAPLALLGQLVPNDPVETPLALVLDDLQWSDDATLELLPALIDAIANEPVAIIGAYRGDELPRGHELRRVRAQLRQRRQLTEIALGPLGADALPALIGGILGGTPEPALTAAVAERTEGVPFFVEELLAALRSTDALVPVGDRIGIDAGARLPLPDTVRDAILLRASGLSPAARNALDTAAVVGLEFGLDQVADWPDELDHCGLITVDGSDRRRFRHALIQEALYADIPWSRRRALHLAVAGRVTAKALVARHLLAGHDLDRARPALVAAADEQLRAYAHRDAARLLTTALEVWPSDVDEPARLAAVERLARCAELSGDHATAVTGLRELAERDPSGEVQRRLAVQYELQGHWPPALAAREAAADAFAGDGRPAEAAAERLAVAAHLRSAASFRAALDVLDLAEANADAAGRVDLLCRIGGLRGNVLARMGRAEEGLTHVRAALDRALQHGLATPAAEVYQRLADSLEHAGDYRAAGQAYDGAVEFCDTNEQGAAGQLCLACATVVLFQGGHWERALAACADVLGASMVTPHARAVATGVNGLIHAMRGQTITARASLLECRAVSRRIELVAMELLSTWGLALLDEAADRPDRAAESYRHAVRRCRETEERHYCIPVLQFAVARFAADGAAADLGAATALLADAAARTGQPEARATFAYALGQSAVAAGDRDAAMSHFRQAIDLFDGLDLPVADTLARLAAAGLESDGGQPRDGGQRGDRSQQRDGGQLRDGGLPRDRSQLRDGGQRGDGGQQRDGALLRQASRTAHRLKARLLIDRIGAPAEPRTLLTPRETEVLRLVADGLTNREIGQRLFLSVRTVEMHARNAMRKLGCRTRAEAAAIAARMG
jgi:DNA-binding CsgD family transcriptional regulator/tetratricopeptide (TPR) repeat protein